MNKLDLKIILALICFLFTSVIFAGPVEQYFQFLRQKEFSYKQFIPPSIEKKIFSQYIDHDDPSLETFFQRYYIDESFSQDENSPVFFYICGESSCEKGALTGAIRHYAEKYKAKLVALEHRYYGESQPKETLSTKNLAYLSTDAALKDLANFQTQITEKQQWKGPWVAFGGSYSGSLAAFYRLQYPELVIGSLASSAPVMAKENFSEYDRHVAQVTGSQCAAAIRQAVNMIELTLDSDDPINKNLLKKRFLAQDVKNDVDFLYLVADVAASAVQYGQHENFCSVLTDAEDLITGYAIYTKQLLDRMKISAVEMTVEGAMDESLDAHNKHIGYRQWLYQSCKEYGYWQTANPEQLMSSRSKRINLKYHREICQRLFNMEMIPETDRMNELFYTALLNPAVSHIFFSNGTNDPWSYLSLTNQNNNTTNPNLVYKSIENAAHCDDLREPHPNDSEALKSARQTMEKLLAEWLGLSNEYA